MELSGQSNEVYCFALISVCDFAHPIQVGGRLVSYDILLAVRGSIAKSTELTIVSFRSLGSALVQLALNHQATFEQWPDHPLTRGIRYITSVKGRPRMREFDEAVNIIGGGSPQPHGPFPFQDSRTVRLLD
jgi:hypothetical protein